MITVDVGGGPVLLAQTLPRARHDALHEGQGVGFRAYSLRFRV